MSWMQHTYSTYTLFHTCRRMHSIKGRLSVSRAEFELSQQSRYCTHHCSAAGVLVWHSSDIYLWNQNLRFVPSWGIHFTLLMLLSLILNNSPVYAVVQLPGCHFLFTCLVWFFIRCPEACLSLRNSQEATGCSFWIHTAYSKFVFTEGRIKLKQMGPKWIYRTNRCSEQL